MNVMYTSMLKHVDDVRQNLERVLQDKSLTLEYRWQVFCEAPSMVKNHEPYIHTFNWESMHRDKEILGWDRSKFETIKTESIVYSMMDNELPDIDDVKEEILAKNLGSFVYDW